MPILIEHDVAILQPVQRGEVSPGYKIVHTTRGCRCHSAMGGRSGDGDRPNVEYSAEQMIEAQGTAMKGKIIMTHSSGSKMGGFMWTTKEGIGAKIYDIADVRESHQVSSVSPPDSLLLYYRASRCCPVTARFSVTCDFLYIDSPR